MRVARTFRIAAWALLVYTLAVILWGALVRATGSGAGCGSHWPLCNGQVVPRDPSIETLVEYVHRVTSGLCWLGALLLPWLARRAFPSGHLARRASVAVFVLMTTEALVGAGLVLFEMVAENASVARGWWMAGHLVNTFLLLGALGLTVLAASSSSTPRPLERPGRATALLGGLVLLLLAGSSGAVAALGDTLFPPRSVVEALAADLSADAHPLVRLRLWHPLLAVAAGGYLVLVAASVGVQTRQEATRRAAVTVGAIVVVQLLLGALNVMLLAPVWMQLVHLLVADVLWLAWVRFSYLALTPANVAPDPARRGLPTRALETA
ncbi:MAG: COX15/CtaA family protein [Myxococcota bacterium]|nr:COX15/CtaA family protein [Myxococcota bacterium]MDW8364051.1 COX15/CtaA family protein [Myxococcales bacterium]